MNYRVTVIGGEDNYIVDEKKLLDIFKKEINPDICRMADLSSIVLSSEANGQVVIRKVKE